MMKQDIIMSKGTVKLNNKICGKVVDFSFIMNNNVQTMNIETKRDYKFEITMKLPLIDRIKQFFGMKTRLDKMLEEMK